MAAHGRLALIVKLLVSISQIVASMGARVATWAMSGVQSDTWRVHSSLHLPEGLDITTLDCKSGIVSICYPEGSYLTSRRTTRGGHVVKSVNIHAGP